MPAGVIASRGSWSTRPTTRDACSASPTSAPVMSRPPRCADLRAAAPLDNRDRRRYSQYGAPPTSRLGCWRRRAARAMPTLALRNNTTWPCGAGRRRGAVARGQRGARGRRRRSACRSSLGGWLSRPPAMAGSGQRWRSSPGCRRRSAADPALARAAPGLRRRVRNGGDGSQRRGVNCRTAFEVGVGIRGLWSSSSRRTRPPTSSRPHAAIHPGLASRGGRAHGLRATERSASVLPRARGAGPRPLVVFGPLQLLERAPSPLPARPQRPRSG